MGPLQNLETFEGEKPTVKCVIGQSPTLLNLNCKP